VLRQAVTALAGKDRATVTRLLAQILQAGPTQKLAGTQVSHFRHIAIRQYGALLRNFM
jgi:hypothetical protein